MANKLIEAQDKVLQMQKALGETEKRLGESEGSEREMLEACSTLFVHLGMAVTVPVVTGIDEDGRMVRFEPSTKLARCVADLKRKCRQAGLPTGPPDGPGDKEDWDDEAE